jgi:hydroxyacyl-ACP dehydratase HTD2-like protein with hotdog domain
VRTEVSQGGQVVISEEQDLVYREPGANGPARSDQSVAPAGRDRPVTVSCRDAAGRVTATGIVS